MKEEGVGKSGKEDEKGSYEGNFLRRRTRWKTTALSEVQSGPA